MSKKLEEIIQVQVYLYSLNAVRVFVQGSNPKHIQYFHVWYTFNDIDDPRRLWIVKFRK